MRKPVTLGLAALTTILVFGGLAMAQQAEVITLRGAEVDEPVHLDKNHGQIETQKIGRAHV